MKKLVVLAVLILTSVSMFSQITSQGKPDVLKSFRMGVCKLVDTNGEITIEAQTRERRYSPNPEVAISPITAIGYYNVGPIAKLEGIQFLIADMEMRIQASRAMAVYGAQMTDAGIPIGTLGNSLKCFASEMCYDVVNMGLQVFAGYGYSREYPLEKLLRDARIYSIFEGTNQVQRQVIGKTLLG